MKLKLLGATAVALSLLSAPVLAQQAPVASPKVDESTAQGTATDTGTTGSIGGNWASDDEKSMYEENREMWSNFFTDDSMSTVKEDAELRAAFSGMGAEDQAAIKAACDRVGEKRGSYGTVTQGLCAQIGQM